jgi:hypothetical protein
MFLNAEQTADLADLIRRELVYVDPTVETRYHASLTELLKAIEGKTVEILPEDPED